MIPVELMTNSTSVGQYDIVISIFTFAPIIAGCVGGMIMSIFLFVAILKKDPTIMWRAQHKSWVYSFWKSPADDIKILPIMEEDIDPSTNTFDYIPKGGKEGVAYTHVLSPTSKGSSKLPAEKASIEKLAKAPETKLSEVEEKKTRFTHKNHPAYIHSFDSFEPHAFVPNSLEATITPAAVYKTKDGSVRKQIDSIRVGDPVSKISVGLILLGIIVVVVGIAAYGQSAATNSFLQDHFGKTATNSTASVPQCPPGYVYNTNRVCTPQVPFGTFLGILFPSFSLKPLQWRIHLGVSKMKSRILSVLSLVFLPSVTLQFFATKTKTGFEQTIGSPYNFDILIIVTTSIVWLSMWTVGSIIGDFFFKRSNKWWISYSSLGEARRMFKLIRRQSTKNFWNMTERESRMEQWLSYFKSTRPTMTYSGDIL